MTPAELEILKQQQANIARYLPNANRPANMSAIAMPEAQGAMVRQAPTPVANRMPMSKEAFNDIQPGLLSRIGTGFQNLRADPVRMAKLQMGFNSMRLNPDAGIAASAADTIKMGETRRLDGLDANATMAYLAQQKGNPMAQAALSAIQANPSMTKDILSAFLTNQFKPQHMNKNIGSIQIAEEDIVENGVIIVKKGGQFTYNLNPNSTGNQYTIIPLSGTGLTADDKNKNLIIQQQVEFDMSQGQKKGEEVFSKFNIIDQQIRNFQRAGELVSEGAKTGFIQKFLPSTSAATTELRTIARTMGIDIINSATFGALSATELNLALETAFDQNLTGDALVEYIQDKIAAQTKLRNALMPEVQMLLGGSGLKAYADYKMDNSKRHDAAQNALSQIQKNNPTLTAEEWKGYNLEQREGVMKDEGLL